MISTGANCLGELHQPVGARRLCGLLGDPSRVIGVTQHPGAEHVEIVHPQRRLFLGDHQAFGPGLIGEALHLLSHAGLVPAERRRHRLGHAAR